MKSILAPILCLALALPGQAATVTGTLQPTSGTNRVVAVQCLPTSTPQIVGTNFVYSINQTIRTDTNGQFSIQLLQGNYQLVIAGKDTVNITVPDSTNSHNFIDLIDPTLTNYVYRTPGALVRVSGTDTTFGFLQEKLTNGLNIEITKQNGGSNEVLSVALPAAIPLLSIHTLTTAAQRDFQGTLTHSGTVLLDFAATNTVRSLPLSGDVEFATTNLAPGRTYKVLITAPATNCQMTFPAWRFVGILPEDILADTVALMKLEAWGTNDTNVIVHYEEE